MDTLVLSPAYEPINQISWQAAVVAVLGGRENVYTRDKGRCQYCAEKLSRAEATYDHITPRAKGGRTRWDNIVIACVTCNSDKRDRTPHEAGMKLLTRPEKPKYLPETLRLTFTKNKVPGQWRGYLRSVVYMHGELDNEND